MRGASLEERVGYLLDREEIREVFHTYALAVDRREWSLLEGVLAEDAVGDYSPVGVFEGREAFVAGLRAIIESTAHTQHVFTNEIITVDGDAAHAEFAGHLPSALSFGEQTEYMSSVSRYRVDLRRTSDGWKIVRFVGSFIWSDAKGVLAQVFEQLAAAD